MKKLGLLSFAAVLSACSFPTLVSAQLRVISEFGIDWAPSDLGSIHSEWGTYFVGNRRASPVFALSLEIPAESIIRLRISGVQCLTSNIHVAYGGECRGADCEHPTRIRALSAAAVLSNPFLFPRLTPYLMVGGGAKRWDFGLPMGFQESGRFREDYRPTLVFGAGVNWDVGVLDGILALSDFVSRSPVEEKRPQHDILVTLGLAYDFRIPPS